MMALYPMAAIRKHSATVRTSIHMTPPSSETRYATAREGASEAMVKGLRCGCGRLK